jgi:carboxymethylenebutenolidase
MNKFISAFILTCVMLMTNMLSSRCQTPSCCQRSVTADFAMLGNDESFKAMHLAPLPFHFVSVRGKMITVSADGKDAAGYEIKSMTPTKNYLFVFQEWWGLNDYIKQEAASLSEELGNVNVIALDLYDGKIGTTPDEAAKIMKETKEERIRSIIKAFIKYAGPDAKIQTIGWCFGGGWSLQAAMMAGKNTTGCVMYYGMPETNTDKLRQIDFPVLGIFASRDANITPEVVGKFEANMKELGKTITVKSYDADHAFANPSNPKFNKEATEDAHGLAVSFLREHLK